jgi:tetratricopeptide (TPR) repeat protein
MADIDEAPSKRKAAPRRKAKRADSELPDTHDPVEIAMVAVATGADRHGAARAVLEKHARLIDIQCQREREEWRVLRVQRLTRWLILLAVAAALAAIGAALWSASRSSSLIIEPFGVPPALERRGLTGKVVSARVLDRLAELQRSTESMRGEKSYANNWQEDIQLDIPQAGISLGEAWRTLKGWLGEETRIGGEIVETNTGLAMTLRAGAVSGGTVQATAAETDKLLSDAAVAIYKVTQPYRYAISRPPDQLAEREAVLLELTGHASKVERKWAYSGLAVTARERGDWRRSRAMALRALAIDPELLPALGNLGFAEQGLGHDQAMVEAWSKLDLVISKGVSDGYDERVARLNHTFSNAILHERFGDSAALLASGRTIAEAGASTFAGAVSMVEAIAASLVHDHRRAVAIAAGFVGTDPEDGDSKTLAAERRLTAAVELQNMGVVREAGLAVLRTNESSLAKRMTPQGRRDTISRMVLPQIAIAYAQVGLAGEARALAAPLPEDCLDCVRAKGWAALARGDRTEARRWFTEAARQAPSLPQPQLDLGALLWRAGDAAGAAAQFEQASGKAPRWADPLKLWGDALGRLGRNAEALRKYEQAARLAPKWGALRLERGKALWRSGRLAEARKEFGVAAGLELSPAARDQLARITAAVGRG